MATGQAGDDAGSSNGADYINEGVSRGVYNGAAYAVEMHFIAAPP